MNSNEWVGYLASLLVLVTFCMQGMVALRAVAIASNVAFITYAALAGIGPVMLLHVLLLPMNVYRLSQVVRERRRDRTTERHMSATNKAQLSLVCPAPQPSDEHRAWSHSCVSHFKGMRMSAIDGRSTPLCVSYECDFRRAYKCPTLSGPIECCGLPPTSRLRSLNGRCPTCR